jgi:hypothetical protein
MSGFVVKMPRPVFFKWCVKQQRGVKEYLNVYLCCGDNTNKRTLLFAEIFNALTNKINIYNSAKGETNRLPNKCDPECQKNISINHEYLLKLLQKYKNDINNIDGFCGENMDQNYINISLRKPESFCIFLTSTHPGIMVPINPQNEILHSVVTFHFEPQSDGSMVLIIDAICAADRNYVKNNGGRRLFTLLVGTCKQLNIQTIQLFAIDEQKTLDFYKKMGFIETGDLDNEGNIGQQLNMNSNSSSLLGVASAAKVGNKFIQIFKDKQKDKKELKSFVSDPEITTEELSRLLSMDSDVEESDPKITSEELSRLLSTNSEKEDLKESRGQTGNKVTIIPLKWSEADEKEMEKRSSFFDKEGEMHSRHFEERPSAKEPSTKEPSTKEPSTKEPSTKEQVFNPIEWNQAHETEMDNTLSFFSGLKGELEKTPGSFPNALEMETAKINESTASPPLSVLGKKRKEEEEEDLDEIYELKENQDYKRGRMISKGGKSKKRKSSNRKTKKTTGKRRTLRKKRGV